MQYYSLQGSKRCHLLIIDIKTRRNMNIRREVQPDISLCRLLRCRCLRLRLGGATIDVMVVMVIVMEIGVIMDYGLWCSQAAYANSQRACFSKMYGAKENRCAVQSAETPGSFNVNERVV
jgi:hypothetical protein